MFELIYMSQANHVFTAKEMAELMAISRKNNAKRDVTGILLYDGASTFIQAIEGDKDDIDELFTIISQDPRHSAIQTISYTEITERYFADWKMAYQRLSQDDIDAVEGFSTFLESDDLLESNGSFAIEMINHFKQTLQQR